MLHELVTVNRTELIRRCRDKANGRAGSGDLLGENVNGVPLFLDQLADTLQGEQLTTLRESVPTEQTPLSSPIGRAAAVHGGELLRLGYSVDQVVHDYGDVCQSVTEMAVELRAEISADEFRTLNRCLDEAIADAVSEYGRLDKLALDAGDEAERQDLGAHWEEHRRLVDIAIYSFKAIKSGNVGISGATSKLLDHTLAELGALARRATPDSAPPISLAGSVTLR